MKNRRYLTKGLAGVLAAGMIAGGALTAFAAEPQTGTMTVQYTKTTGSDFVLSIPSTVELSEETYKTAEIKLSSINVTDTEKVQVSAAGGVENGQVTLTGTAGSVASTVSLTEGGNSIGRNAVVAEFEGTGLTAARGGTLYFSKLENVQPGSYSGTINFTAAIVTK